VQQCLEYRDRLRAIEPNVDYLMSLYLHEDITPEVIREAKKAGITGVKSYPAGVTTVRTNSHHLTGSDVNSKRKEEDVYN
jgi:dihydroorotase